MDREKKTGMIEFMKMMLGEEVMADILSAPSTPSLQIERGEISLGIELSEEEKFFYSLLPSPENGQRLRLQHVPIVELLYNLWWCAVRSNHGLFGDLGIRVGWKLVCPKPQKVIFAEIEVTPDKADRKNYN